MTDPVDVLRSIDADSFASEEQRKAAVVEAHALLARIETPWETGIRNALGYPALLACLKTATDLGLFTKWLELNNGGNASQDKLASLVKCDSVLLNRLLRHLGTMSMLRMHVEGHVLRYEMTPYTVSLVKDDLASTLDHAFDLVLPSCWHLPDYLAKTGYQNPSGKNSCFKSWAGKEIWEYLTDKPRATESLGRYMKATQPLRGTLSAIYDCEQLDLRSGSADDVLLVDVGGSVGHDLQHFAKKFPDAVGRLVLEDLIDTIKDAKVDTGIETIGYDFFTEQPVKGAKAYYLHAVLHDWPDTDALRILENVKQAMRPGWSKLLIEEALIRDNAPDMYGTSADWTMMWVASSRESKSFSFCLVYTFCGFDC